MAEKYTGRDPEGEDADIRTTEEEEAAREDLAVRGAAAGGALGGTAGPAAGGMTGAGGAIGLRAEEPDDVVEPRDERAGDLETESEINP